MTDRTLLCPACQTPLVARRLERGAVWACPRCSGCLVGIALLRKGADSKAVGRFWSLAVEQPRPRRCPVCQRAFATAPMPAGPELDACRTCFLVWCDGGELEHIPRRLPLVPATIPRPSAPVPAIAASVDDEAMAIDLACCAAEVAFDLIASW